MTDKLANVLNKTWVDQDLQDPLIEPVIPTPRRISLCENRFIDKLVDGTSSLVNSSNFLFILVILVIDIVLFFLIKFEVLDFDTPLTSASWVNITVQVAVSLYTFVCVACFPSLFRNLFRIYQMKESGVPDGTNWEGKTSSNFFDYIPILGRITINFSLNLACILQFINQGIRWKYFSYNSAQDHKLNIMVANSCFSVSIVCALLAGLYALIMYVKLKMSGKLPNGNEGSSSSSLSSPPLAI